MSLSSIPRELRRAVRERDNGQCGYCRLHQTGQAAAFHINHVIPRSKGGLTTLENLVLQCPSCSLHKSDKIASSDPQTGESTELFHPLELVWNAHFRLLDDGRCIGLTPVGRATVEALRMNDPLPRTARAIQRVWGLI